MPLSRRLFLASSLAAARVSAAKAPVQRLKIMVTGGHPGDPECGCGGTIARFVQLGHEVTVVYLNRGEGFCGDSKKPCAEVRTEEVRKSSLILKVRPVFLRQVDGKAVVDETHHAEFRKVFDSDKPDALFTHWPVDSHRDHRAMADLALDAWLAAGKRGALYYYQVVNDTSLFRPTEYVDISSSVSSRRAACYAHASQNPDKWYPAQVEITRGYGRTRGVVQAEGFIRHADSPAFKLP